MRSKDLNKNKKFGLIVSQEFNWVPPANSELIAAFQYGSGTLVACDGQSDGEGHTASADQTWAAWETVQGLPDAALMVLKCDDRVSLGAINGGIIIEGRSKMNIGLVRASTRKLAPVAPAFRRSPALDSQDRFRRTFWKVLSRLQGAKLPRAFEFYLAGVTGQIHAARGEITFSGDFLNPADFVGELRAACAIEEDVRYTLGDVESNASAEKFSTRDLLHEVVPTDPSGAYIFERKGWPIAIADKAEVSVVQMLSSLTSTFSAKDAGKGSSRISVLSGSNLPLLSGSISADGTVRYEVS